jgi:hypothetical protein
MPAISLTSFRRLQDRATTARFMAISYAFRPGNSMTQINMSGIRRATARARLDLWRRRPHHDSIATTNTNRERHRT